MMKPFGKTLVALTTLLLMISSVASRAEVVASLDRDRVAMGDTLRLTITASEDEEISDTDLRPLLADFEIIQRSTSSKTSIANGRRTHIKQLLIDITPRREGTLKIPPMRVGQRATNKLSVAVAPAPDISTGGQTVLFEATVDRDSAYVQGQVILTLRIQQAINLDARSISELELDNAFVKPLEQKSFERNIDGRRWLVHEVRYAIFPEQSGSLVIPAQTFSARESQPRRSLFDLGSTGRQLRRNTDPISINVLPRPDNFPATTWLPAQKITLEEHWSTPPEQLRAGESATRSIRILGEGLQGAQLPPILFPATQGLKYYPDQPEINDTEVASGLLGVRRDSAAVVPTREGNWSIPEIRIPWWDTESGEVRYAVIPGREIMVAAADPATTAPAAPAAITPGNIPSLSSGNELSSGNVRQWQILSAVSGTGWLLTLAYLFWSRRTPGDTKPRSPDNPDEKHAFKQLLAACASDSAVPARQAIVNWASVLFPQATVVSLNQVAAVFADEELNTLLHSLNQCLYSPQGDPWRGAPLINCVKRLRSQQRKPGTRNHQTLELYPRAA